MLTLSMMSLVACGSEQTTTTNPETDIASLTDAGARLAMACAGCHSETSGAIASLSGYDEETLILRLSDYKSDASGTTVMHRLARGYSEDQIQQVSAYLTTSEAGE